MTTISISKDLDRQIKPLLRMFNYASEEEFAREALEDKVLQLRKGMFFTLTDDIRQALRRKGITVEQIVAEFERRQVSPI